MSQDQKDNRVTAICRESLDRSNGDEMVMKQIITGVESQKSNHHVGSANFRDY